MIVERIVPGTRCWDIMFEQHRFRYDLTLPYIQNKTVLDVACGTGFFSHYLIQKGARKVIGIDIDHESIRFAKNHFRNNNLQFFQADAHEIGNLPEKFDIVVSIETIEHLFNPEKFLQGLQNVLYPNGMLIISTPNAEKTVGRNPFHVKEFSALEFTNLLDKFFRIQKINGINYTDQTKKRHRFIYQIFAKIIPRKIKNVIPLNGRIFLAYIINKKRMYITQDDARIVYENDQYQSAEEFVGFCVKNDQ